MGLFGNEARGLFPRATQRADGLFNLPALAQLHEPGTITFTNRVPIHSGRDTQFERFWAAIIQNEGGTGTGGEFLTSPRGAVGPAQVRPNTAPEAARLANLPWDERRYRTDAQYNIAIGRAYYRQQLREFRDPVLAAAAYNWGPTALRAALRRSERSGRPIEHFLPAQTRDYIARFRRQLENDRGRSGAQRPRAEG